MSNSFKLCPTHFSRGCRKSLQRSDPPWLRAWCKLYQPIMGICWKILGIFITKSHNLQMLCC